jgi:iron complex outermembrane receptor protein
MHASRAEWFKLFFCARDATLPREIARTRLRGWVLVPLLALAWVRPAACAEADAAGSTGAAANSGMLEEVVVSARYVKENLQEVPLAVTAVTGVELQSRAITDIAQLSAVVPNLYTHPGDAEEGPTPTISMRGVTAGDYSFARYPAVGIYVDDVYHSTMVGANLDLNDIERIEVKRGPQGTLAGNASIAGTISIYSQVPSGKETGYFTVAYGSYHEVIVKGAFDTTIAPDLFLRVSGQSRRQDGYVDQLDFTCEMNALGTPQLAGTFPTADNSAYERSCKTGTFGGVDDVSAKAVLRYVGIDRLDLTAMVAYTRDADQAPAEILINTHPAPADGFDSVYSSQLFNKYGVVYDSRFLPPAGDRYSAYTTFCRPLSGICFNNSQGQYSSDSSLRASFQLTDKINILGILAYSGNGGNLDQAGDVSPLGYVQGQVFFATQQTTAEVRVTGSSFADKLDWVGGVYYLNSENHLSGAIDFVTENFTENDHFHTDSKSGFLHGDFHVTDRFSISAGGRFSNNVNSASLDHPPLFNTTIPFSVSASRGDYLVAASYKFTPDIMTYASISTGFRPAGISTIVNSIYQLTEYPAEKLTAYEVGTKTEWFDHSLRVNLAAFYNDYPVHLTSQAGFQCLGQAPPPTRVLLSTDCPPGGAIGWAITIGTPAVITGGELEVTAEPVRDLLLNFSTGFNHLINGVTNPKQPGYLVAGNLPQPEWNADAGIQYTLGLGAASLTPRLDAVYTSLQTFTQSPSLQAPTPQTTVPAHTIFNGQVSYQTSGGHWTLTASGTNILNKYYFYDIFLGSTVATAGVIAPPREWRLTASKKF